ncbi:hypothetical protein OSB04_un000233 [Centaurea solstitialis]|uniref:F-box domain-containing protein n=1 Tax=Centaurea solstitialis TaxID=347529 RepID=A0AA38W3V1_9ASTR|nr:hypothetical protein OSB04_un000233 [Centaurea solstitialis]
MSGTPKLPQLIVLQYKKTTSSSMMTKIVGTFLKNWHLWFLFFLWSYGVGGQKVLFVAETFRRNRKYVLNQFTMEDLPPNVMSDILTRLPTKKINYCMCVCNKFPTHALLIFTSRSSSSLIISCMFTSLIHANRFTGIGHVRYGFDHCDQPLLDDHIHWLFYDDDSFESPCAFDLDKKWT